MPEEIEECPGESCFIEAPMHLVTKPVLAAGVADADATGPAAAAGSAVGDGGFSAGAATFSDATNPVAAAALGAMGSGGGFSAFAAAAGAAATHKEYTPGSHSFIATMITWTWVGQWCGMIFWSH